MTVALQDPALLLGGLSGLNLLMTTTDPATGARIHALGDDFKLGDPEAVIASIQSQLQDGDLERHDRDGNREATIPLRIDAPDSDVPGDAIAQMQAALDAACRFDGWTELVYTSPLAGAEPSVFEVTSATVSTTFDDLREMKQGCRYVTLTIHARPFARALETITLDAPAVVGSTTTSVDSGSSTTGWSMLSTAPAPYTNLLTNPNFATNTTGWSLSTNASALVTDTRWGGSVGRVTGSSLARIYIVNTTAFPVTGGDTYQFGLDGGIRPTGFRIRFYSDAGGTVQVGSDVDLIGSGDPAHLSTTSTAPSTAVTGRVLPFVANTLSSRTDTGYFDKLWVSKVIDGRPSGFFDGATPNTTAITYAWTSAANASTSTATWTAPSLAVVSGAVKGTVYGRSSVSIRRNNTGITLAAMTILPYIRIRGTATAASDGRVTIADNGGSMLATTSYSYNKTTGAFDIIVKKSGGFTNLDVTFERTSGTVSTTAGIFVSVDQIDITDNPFSTGKVQSRQVQIFGSQRTELSLSVLGLDAAGTTPVGLGEQVLIHTAAAGEDGRAKFLACRQATGLAGTATDTSAVSGAYNTVNNTTPIISFTPAASSIVTGNYQVVARVRCATVGSIDIGIKAIIGSVGAGTAVSDPPTGTKGAPLVTVASGAVWPQVNQATGSPAGPWVMLPLGILRLPPAPTEDDTATLTIQIFRNGSTTAFDLDELFLLNDDVGQTSIVVGSLASGTYSAVRLDAATVDSPQATAWVGTALSPLTADPTRWFGQQHTAAPGLLQVSTVTPGCSTSRVSAEYPPRFHTHVATIDLGA